MTALALGLAWRALLLGGLAYGYDRGMFLALQWFNMLELPWMPYAGKSPVTVALLIHTASALAVLTVALPVGGAAALATRARPLLCGLGVAAPTFADQVRSVPPLLGKTLFTGLFSAMYCLEVLLPMLLLPALAAWLARRLLCALPLRARAGEGRRPAAQPPLPGGAP